MCVYVCIYVWTYMCVYIYIYIYLYIISPPLNNNPPNKKHPLWGDFFVTINLDGGTITPLINDDFWFDLPPS